MWSLFAYLESFHKFIKSKDEQINSIAAALIKTNHNLEYRAAIFASDSDELIERVSTLIENRKSDSDKCIHCSFDLKVLSTSRSVSAVRESVMGWLSGKEMKWKISEKGYHCAQLPGYVFDHNEVFKFPESDDKPNLSQKKDPAENSGDGKYYEFLEKIRMGQMTREEFKSKLKF